LDFASPANERHFPDKEVDFEARPDNAALAVAAAGREE